MVDSTSSSANQQQPPRSALLVHEILRCEPPEAALRLANESPETIASVLAELPTAKAVALLPRFEASLRATVLQSVGPEQRTRWLYNQQYPLGTVGRLMEPAVALFAPTGTVREAIEQLRVMVTQGFVSYGYVVDEQGHLIGALVMRELLLAQPGQLVRDIMVGRPVSLQATQRIGAVIPLVHRQLLPEYPVCDERGRIMGIVRGYALFEEQTLELSAQPGKMLGLDREERIRTAPWRSLHLRHPWLQINLLSSFLAAGVVGLFENVVAQMVAIAAFVPVMVGQSASTGGQALSVALRGLTLGEVTQERWRTMIRKECLVGIGNGALVGVTAAAGIYAFSVWHGHAAAGRLAFAMLLAMIVSTMLSSVVGAVMPLLMKQAGFDPATASTILVGGITRVLSIAAFLAMAQWLVT